MSFVRKSKSALASLAALCAACLLASAVAWAGDANAPGVNGIRLGLDTDNANVPNNLLPITGNAFADPRAVLSVGLPSIDDTEQLRIRAEAQVSRCNTGDFNGDCAGTSTYNYAPTIRYHLIYGSTANDTSGNAITPWNNVVCNEGKHHCPFTIRDVNFDVPLDSSMRYVNLVVAADNSAAGGGDRVVVEEADGPADHGRLSVFRLGQNRKSIGQPSAAGNVVDDTRDVNDLPISVVRGNVDYKVVYSRQLTNLNAGDFLDVRGDLHVTNGQAYNYDPLVGAYIILAKQPTDEQADPANGEPFVTTKNGQNCTDHTNNGCTLQKAGGVRIPDNANSTMYLNLIGYAQRDSAPNGANDHVLVVNDGEISRVKYTAAP